MEGLRQWIWISSKSDLSHGDSWLCTKGISAYLFINSTHSYNQAPQNIKLYESESFSSVNIVNNKYN